jgi:DNA modification methylase
MSRSFHPFPARMAPELALNTMRGLGGGSVVLDPMSGSGTVGQQARRLGLSALGFDLDPLAVLISKVSTTPIDEATFDREAERFVSETKSLSLGGVRLPWIDGDSAAESFVNYWFGERQRDDLRRIAGLLSGPSRIDVSEDVADCLRVALSRIIITKKQSASLAQDTSHSRPHKVAVESDYDVFDGFERSIRALRKRIADIPKSGDVVIRRGDARSLALVESESVDAVLTSPPYLNAIDYMRGHKMSLIWLGHRLGELTSTRSDSIGAERRPDVVFDSQNCLPIKVAMGELSDLPPRYTGMIDRYVMDLREMAAEVARVLKPKVMATFVIGNSCLKGVYIENSEALLKAAEIAGLSKVDRWERDLPPGSRYLPTPASGTLSKRMRKEVILRVSKP